MHSMPKTIDDKAQYRVTMKSKVDRGNGVWLLPGHLIKVSGKVLKDIKESVETAELVE